MNRLIKSKYHILTLIIFLVSTFLSAISPAHAQDLTPETSAAGGFNSQFNGSMAGWASMGSVKMDVNSKYLYTNGVTGYWGQAYRNTGQFSNYTYTVMMKRLFDQNSPNCLFVHMGTSLMKDKNLWYPGYAFCYRNYGWYGIFRRAAGGGTVVIQGWTKTPDIAIMGWNKLKVVTSGTSFKFYINDKLQKSFSDAHRTKGYVGIGCFDNGVYREQLRVDWATLTKTY